MTVDDPRTFLTLPPEIRLQIYPYLLSTQHCLHKQIVFPNPDEPSLANPEQPLSEIIPRAYTFHTAILRTCRLIHAECTSYMRHANQILRIITPWPTSAIRIAGHGRVPLIAVNHAARKYKSPVLDARVQVHGEAARQHAMLGECAMLIALDDLPKFTQFWWFSSLSFHMLNTHLGLTLTLYPPESTTPINNTQSTPFEPNDNQSTTPTHETQSIPYKLQQKLLLPFTSVRHLASFTLQGPVNPQIRTLLTRGMQQDFPTQERCLEDCTSLKNEGNALLKEGKYHAAIEKYNAAHAAIFVIVDGKRRDVWGEDHFKQYCTSGMYEGQVGIVVSMVLRVQLVANTMQAYLKLEEWEEVRYWGERSIRLMTLYMEDPPDEPRPGFPGGPEIGKIYYRTGIAHKHLGSVEDSRECFRVAEKWLPNDEIVRKAAMEGRPRLL